MNRHRVPDELRRDHASASPRLHDFLLTALVKRLNLLEKLFVDVGSFFCRIVPF